MTSAGNEAELRRAIVEAQCNLVSRGLTSGTSGNVSARLTADEMLITPTGVAPDELLPAHIVRTDLAGRPVGEQLAPSSEWRIHADIYRARPAAAMCHWLITLPSERPPCPKPCWRPSRTPRSA